METDFIVCCLAESAGLQLFVQPCSQREHHIRIDHIGGKEQTVCKFLQKCQAECLIPHNGPAAAVGAEVTVEVGIFLKQLRHPSAGDNRTVAPAVAAFLILGFMGNEWKTAGLIWPVAAVLFPAVLALVKMFEKKDN